MVAYLGAHAGEAATRSVRHHLKELNLSPDLWMTKEETTTVAADGTEKTTVKYKGSQPVFQLSKNEKNEICGPSSAPATVPPQSVGTRSSGRLRADVNYRETDDENTDEDDGYQTSDESEEDF
eukprot:jgi/Mesvir1/7341/Mv19150-RA.1